MRQKVVHQGGVKCSEIKVSNSLVFDLLTLTASHANTVHQNILVFVFKTTSSTCLYQTQKL